MNKKSLIKHIFCNHKCKCDGRKCNSNQKCKNDKFQFECKKLIKHRVRKECYAWNPSICACECDKDWEIYEYLKDFNCIKIVLDDLVITCGEIVDTGETVLIDSIHKKAIYQTDHYNLQTFILVITCILLLIIVATNWHCIKWVKQKIIIPY